MTLEYITLFIYFGFLLLLGGLFARFNRSLSDFARGGAQLTWWMVGTSMTMAGISAFTFTGNASAAFEAGPSLLIVYGANILGFVLGAFFLGPWYRQTRAYTGADVVRARYGTAAEQFSVYTGVLLGPFGAAVQLWALGVFVSSVFGFPLITTIIVIGAICVIYSTSGGAWAVIATDFVQGIVLFSITVMLGLLSLAEVGWISGLFSSMRAPEVADAFRLFNESGEFSMDRYTLKWAAAAFIMQLMTQTHLGTAVRYLAVKDGREARRAASLALVLMTLGSLVWFIPPVVARLLFADEVMAMTIPEPGTAAYAVTARHLLPNGLMGVMIAAMFAATMSSLDSGLTAQASTIVRNLIPRIREALKFDNLREVTEVTLCRSLTVGLGIMIISLSILLSQQTRFILFDAYFTATSVIGVPVMLPLIAGILFRRLASWSYFFIFGVSFIPSLYSLLHETRGGDPWTIQDRAFWVLSFGLAAIVIARLLNRYSSRRHIERERVFFEKMFTPVDFAKEIGENRDRQQAVFLGQAVMAMGCLLFLLLLVPNPWADRLIVLGLATMVLAVGGTLRLLAGPKVPKPPSEAKK